MNRRLPPAGRAAPRGARITVTNHQSSLSIHRRDVSSIAAFALDQERCANGVDVALVDDETIVALHGRYFGDPTPTDVITFPSYDATGGEAATERASLGEIVISTDAAIRQAPHFLGNPVHETLLYVVHGVLHLVGYDDRAAPARRRMKRRERAIFAAWLADPARTPGSSALRTRSRRKRTNEVRRRTARRRSLG